MIQNIPVKLELLKSFVAIMMQLRKELLFVWVQMYTLNEIFTDKAHSCLHLWHILYGLRPTTGTS